MTAMSFTATPLQCLEYRLKLQTVLTFKPDSYLSHSGLTTEWDIVHKLLRILTQLNDEEISDLFRLLTAAVFDVLLPWLLPYLWGGIHPQITWKTMLAGV
jgi:hypothetical protein